MEKDADGFHPLNVGNMWISGGVVVLFYMNKLCGHPSLVAWVHARGWVGPGVCWVGLGRVRLGEGTPEGSA